MGARWYDSPRDGVVTACRETRQLRSAARRRGGRAGGRWGGQFAGRREGLARQRRGKGIFQRDGSGREKVRERLCGGCERRTIPLAAGLRFLRGRDPFAEAARFSPREGIGDSFGEGTVLRVGDQHVRPSKALDQGIRAANQMDASEDKENVMEWLFQRRGFDTSGRGRESRISPSAISLVIFPELFQTPVA